MYEGIIIINNLVTYKLLRYTTPQLYSQSKYVNIFVNSIRLLENFHFVTIDIEGHLLCSW